MIKAPSTHRTVRLALVLSSFVAVVGLQAQTRTPAAAPPAAAAPRAPRQPVAMDTARAAALYVSNLIFRLSYKGPSHQRSFSTQRELSDLPFEQRAEYVKRSPYYHVDSLTRPLLVHIASNDEDVDFVEARPLVDALVARKPGLAETKIYWDPTPGPASVGHTFSRRVDRQTLLREDSPEQIDSWNRVWNFFAWSLKPAAGAMR